ncbi:helix-turn-helix domain-containing protein [Mechercharimyces sp. CAU 1602]|uniref:helix-turn-helix domain-containing protein n=1 Tax=Mechercharimyces sp. CAU 1602 TaxID=2973933 RepID=UPI002162BBFC|nr:helix-turn-helix transcriptional regulator [Mechercharimyces sp. CAU 1602]MCS1350260.1 helix-turn-helix transcriptional regulator [Mechercharimyces sp. CAU 1602]
MITVYPEKAGEIIRRIRKEKGLRLEDVADDNISPATVSNIERGVPHVLPAKVAYLMDKLSINQADLSARMMGVEQELGFMELKMTSIESLLDQGNYDVAEKGLRQFDGLGTEHPLSAMVCYLKGKLFISKKNLLRAEKEFFNAIRLAERNHNVIDVDAYNSLSFIAYFNNDLESALKYVNKGLDRFSINGDRDHLYDVLIINKIAYLEKLDRIGEAISIIGEVWDRKEDIKKPDLLLHLYHLKVNLLCKTGYYEEAIEVGLEGIHRARLTNEYIRIHHIWDSLGGVFLRVSDLDSAEVCLEHALSLEGLIKTKNYFVTTLIKKGILHMRRGEQEQADKFLHRAISLGKEEKADVYLLDALATMGDLRVKQIRYDESVVYYRQALRIAERLKFKHKQHSILFRILLSLQETGSEEFSTELTNMFEVQKELKENPMFSEII